MHSWLACILHSGRKAHNRGETLQHLLNCKWTEPQTAWLSHELVSAAEQLGAVSLHSADEINNALMWLQWMWFQCTFVFDVVWTQYHLSDTRVSTVGLDRLWWGGAKGSRWHSSSKHIALSEATMHCLCQRHWLGFFLSSTTHFTPANKCALHSSTACVNSEALIASTYISPVVYIICMQGLHQIMVA